MKKLTIAGNALADVIKRIDAYPSPGMLCKIGEIVRGVGGSVPNTGIDLKTLDPQGIEVKAIARLGKDENGAFIKKVLSSRGVDISGITEDDALATSFTDVMTLPNGDRTFLPRPRQARFSVKKISTSILWIAISFISVICFCSTRLTRRMKNTERKWHGF